MSKFSVLVLTAVALLVIAVDASPIDRERLFERKEEPSYHHPVARQYGGYMDTGGMGGGMGGMGGMGDGMGGMGGMGGGMGGMGGGMGGMGGGMGVYPNSMDSKVVLVQTIAQTVGATAPFMTPIVNGTKNMLHNAQEGINKTYHRTTSKLHNVTMTVKQKIFHPLSNPDQGQENEKEKEKEEKEKEKEKEKKSENNARKEVDKVSRRNFLETVARAVNYSPNAFKVFQSTSPEDEHEQDLVRSQYGSERQDEAIELYINPLDA